MAAALAVAAVVAVAVVRRMVALHLLLCNGVNLSLCGLCVVEETTCFFSLVMDVVKW